MILDAITKKLQVVLSGAITTNQLHVNASWGDTQSGDTFVPGATSALTNSATPVDIVAAPAASTQRRVREVTVFNADTVAATVTVQTVDGANTRKNFTATIQTGETLVFADGVWNTLTTSGAVKGSAGVSSVALTVPARQAVTGSPITTFGTLAITDNVQTANTVFRGPTSGSPAVPTFGVLVSADMPSSGAGSGTVTSVALTVPARQTVTGSPIIASGTFAVTDNAQTANIVFAGPVSGGAATPAFRALVNADMPTTGAGSGTVTSVALALPAIFTVTGSPIIASGTLTGALATQTANTLFAGPTTGAAAAPTFRVLTAADLNSLAFTAGSVPFGNATGGLDQDNADFFWDNTNKRLGIGTNAPAQQIDILGAAAAGRSQLVGLTGALIGQRASTTANNGPTSNYQRSRGATVTAPGAVIQGDRLGTFNFQGWDGSVSYRNGGNILFNVIEPTPGPTAMGGQFIVNTTPLASVTATETMRLEFNTGLSMYGANVVVDQNRLVQLRPFTVATLPTAPGDGKTAFVTDAALTTFGIATTGGGANHIPVYYNSATVAWMTG